MTLVSFASAKASPGVTTLAFSLARARTDQRSTVVIEADPDGGTIAARLGLGYEPGIVELAAALHREPLPADAGLSRFEQRVADLLSVVPAPGSSEQTSAALSSSAASIATTASGVTADAFADLGRVTGRSPSLTIAQRSAFTVLVSRPTVDEIQLLPSRVDLLHRSGCAVYLVSVGDRPYDPSEIASHLGVGLLGTWVDDPDAATAAWDPGQSRRVARTTWWRSTVALAERVAALAANQREPDQAALR